MKTAVVIADGLRQIVLTPESDEEKSIIRTLTNQEWNVEIKKGTFYICQGGYVRFGIGDTVGGGDEGAIIVLRTPREG